MSLRPLLAVLPLLVACSGDAKDSADADGDGTTDGAVELTESVGDEIPDPSVCDEEYSFCGYLVTPSDFEGTTRSLALALYTSIPPAGPPSAILAEIALPTMGPNERYPVRLAPVIETGEYYLWANLYMEGGGTWVPENDIDYTANSEAPLLMEAKAMEFEDITLSIASGW